MSIEEVLRPGIHLVFVQDNLLAAFTELHSVDIEGLSRAWSNPVIISDFTSLTGIDSILDSRKDRLCSRAGFTITLCPIWNFDVIRLPPAGLSAHDNP